MATNVELSCEHCGYATPDADLAEVEVLGGMWLVCPTCAKVAELAVGMAPPLEEEATVTCPSGHTGDGIDFGCLGCARTFLDRIAVRTDRGRREFRAYPYGVHHADGGFAPWVESEERAAALLAHADRVFEADLARAAAAELTTA